MTARDDDRPRCSCGAPLISACLVYLIVGALMSFSLGISIGLFLGHIR